jgi:DNA helicase-2/ATP-dependent DNA helicase PcrA
MSNKITVSFEPSPYQKVIFDWILTGRGHAAVEAVAGSGKTTTLVECAKLIKGAGLFLAFNKHIAEELGAKLAGTSMEAKTIHSVGFGSLRSNVSGKINTNNYKYRDMVKEYAKEAQRGYLLGAKLSHEERRALLDGEDGFPVASICKLIDLARLNLIETTDEELFALAGHYEVELPFDGEAACFRCVRDAMERGKKMLTVIDFTDMLWLPVVHNFTARTYAWVFVDEAQDLSKAQLAIVKKCLAPGARMMAVGDRRQAIYGFAGADAYSFQRIVDEMKATVLPLSVCYRCPASHIAMAKELCPQIEPRPSAPEGTVRTIRTADVTGQVHEGDLIMCRVNAPLLGLCYELLASGISAAVRGRDIGVGLCKVVREASEMGSWDAFGEALKAWQTKQAAAILRRYNGDEDKAEDALSALGDKVECIRVIHGRVEAKNAAELQGEINKLFSIERPSVMLSSIHRAKGLEERRVFVLEPARLRNPRGTGWRLEQEHNLHYVSLTRAKEELIFVE